MKRNTMAGNRIQAGFGLQVFAQADIEDIHLSTIEILQQNGIYFQCDDVLKRFADASADVDFDSHIVKIPPYMVEESIRTAPRKFALCGRDPSRDVILEKNRVNFLPFGEGVMVIDPFTGEYRKSVKQDQAWACRLTDALDSYDIGEFIVSPQDIHADVMCLHNYEATVHNTTKHILQCPETTEQAELLIDMAASVVGGRDKLRERPIVSGGACPQSPLSIAKGCSDAIVSYANAGLPMLVLSMAMSGGTSPMTIAGTLVTHNCEVLAGLVLSQLVSKGAPFIYGSSTTVMDLRKAVATVGCPELGMISAGVTKLAQSYGLPCYVAGS